MMSTSHLTWARAFRLVWAASAAAAAPLQAQVATVSVFGPTAQPMVAQDEGAVVRTGGGFSLRELGHWSKDPARIHEAVLTGIPELPIGGQMSLSGTMPVIASPCSATGPAPPRPLSRRRFLARQTWWPMIAAAECRFGLPTGLMDSVILAESGYDPTITSPAGAAGLAQLMPATARQLGVLDRFDPLASAEGGARYLRDLLDSFGGNIPLALAAYNAGPAAVRRVGAIPSNGETPVYVRRVLKLWTQPGIGIVSPALPARRLAILLGFSPS